MLFNLYIEQAINEIKEKLDFGIKIQGQYVKMIRFADDIAVIASSKAEL